MVIFRPYDSLQKGDVARNNELVSIYILLCVYNGVLEQSVCQFTVCLSPYLPHSTRLSE